MVTRIWEAIDVGGLSNPIEFKINADYVSTIIYYPLLDSDVGRFIEAL